jgi:hypothetical protein
MRYRLVLIAVVLCVAAFTLAAQENPGQVAAREPAIETPPEDTDDVVIAGKKFTSARFGAGISLTTDLHGDSRVDEAEIVDGVVRIKKDSDVRARVMLETHVFAKGFKYLPVVEEEDDGDDDDNEPRISMRRADSAPEVARVPMVGLGPFVAIQPGSDQIIDAVALGIMVGFRRTQSLKDSSSLNIGFGYVVDPDTQLLGEGIEPNKPLPGNETQIRFRHTSQGGILFLTSFSF